MIQGVIDGVSAYGKVFSLISRMRLWGFILVPGLISLVMGLVIFGLAWGGADDIAQWLISFYPWEQGKGVVEKIAVFLGWVAFLAIGLILFKHLVMAIAAPFMSPLSEKIEKELIGKESGVTFSLSQALSDLVRGITISVRNIIRELFFTGLLLFLSLVPLFSPFTPFLIFLLQAYYAGFGNMDFTLERHFNVRGSVHFVRRNWGLAVGNGAVFLLILFTGVGFLFALPLATIAATLETVKRLER